MRSRHNYPRASTRATNSGSRRGRPDCRHRTSGISQQSCGRNDGPIAADDSRAASADRRNELPGTERVSLAQAIMNCIIDGFALAGLSIHAYAPYPFDDVTGEETRRHAMRGEHSECGRNPEESHRPKNGTWFCSRWIRASFDAVLSADGTEHHHLPKNSSVRAEDLNSAHQTPVRKADILPFRRRSTMNK